MRGILPVSAGHGLEPGGIDARFSQGLDDQAAHISLTDFRIGSGNNEIPHNGKSSGMGSSDLLKLPTGGHAVVRGHPVIDKRPDDHSQHQAEQLGRPVKQ